MVSSRPKHYQFIYIVDLAQIENRCNNISDKLHCLIGIRNRTGFNPEKRYIRHCILHSLCIFFFRSNA